MSWSRRILIVLAGAVLIHAVALFALPPLIMNRAIEGIVERAGGFNRAVHQPRATDKSRTIVRPSPDILYTACAFDLSAGPVWLTAPPPLGYLSLSVFAANTDNVAVLNETALAGRPLAAWLALPGQAAGLPAPVLISQSPRGVVLYRAIVEDEAQLAQQTDQQKRQRCDQKGRL